MIRLLAALLAAAPIETKLTAHLPVTNQPGTVLLRWQEDLGFELPNVKAARRGEPVGALVLFSGCTGDKEGHCNVSTDTVILDPAGKVSGPRSSPREASCTRFPSAAPGGGVGRAPTGPIRRSSGTSPTA